MPSMPDSAPIIAYIALGSNLGDREANIREALRRLSSTGGIVVRKVSSFLDNPAVGGPAGSPPYLNAAAEIETALDPHDLLRALLRIETAMGRVRKVRWEPRVIDLDILFHGRAIIRTPDLTVPHPLMHERRFVLVPLAEIAPTAEHPVFGKSVAQLLCELPRT